MKFPRILALGVAAGFALCAAGCAKAPASSADTASVPALPAATATPVPAESRTDIPTGPAASGIAPVTGSLTPEDVGRPGTTMLQRNAEGEIEDIPCTLFIGDGYSIYLPDGGWKQTQAASRADYTADVFTSVDNDAVTLSVVPNYTDLEGGDVTLEEAYAALCSEGYLQSDDNDAMFALSQDGVVTCQYVVELSEVVWYVSWSYPDTTEYLEGFGSMLPIVAESFAVNPPAIG